MNEPAEKRAGRQHDPPGVESPSIAEHQPGDPAGIVENQILGRTLDNCQTRDLVEQLGHCAAVQLAVRLSARSAHRRPLAAVQHAELDAGAIDRAAHEAVERIDLADQMALGETADRRVARHLADRRAAVR